MKYIRTKDNIYEECARERCPNGCVITTSGVRVPYTDIIFQSDRIEDVCDFIFVKDEYGDYRLYDLKDRNTDKEYLKESWTYGWLKELYYCIKTDKGLIYKAKMNEKGELELL